MDHSSNSLNKRQKLDDKIQEVNLEVDNVETKLDDQKEKKLDAIIKSIEDSKYKAVRIKREYKLKQGSDMELWLDSLRSELRVDGLVDVIDEKENPPQNLSENAIEMRKNLVRDIIITHLDEKYHRRIMTERDPKMIIDLLKQIRISETNFTCTAMRANLNSFKMKPKEKVFDFCERFDTLIRDYESSLGAEPMTEKDKRATFFNAVAGVIPDLVTVDYTQ